MADTGNWNFFRKSQQFTSSVMNHLRRLGSLTVSNVQNPPVQSLSLFAWRYWVEPIWNGTFSNFAGKLILFKTFFFGFWLGFENLRPIDISKVFRRTQRCFECNDRWLGRALHASEALPWSWYYPAAFQVKSVFVFRGIIFDIWETCDFPRFPVNDLFWFFDFLLVIGS